MEVASRLESTELPLDPGSEDTWSLVFLWLPAATSLLGSAGPPVGLEEGLRDYYHCFSESVPVSGVGSGIWSMPCVELCSLLTSTSGEVTWDLFHEDGKVGHWE